MNFTSGSAPAFITNFTAVRTMTFLHVQCVYYFSWEIYCFDMMATASTGDSMTDRTITSPTNSMTVRAITSTI